MNEEVDQLKKLLAILTKENKHLKQVLAQHNITYSEQNEEKTSNEGNASLPDAEQLLSPQEKIKLYRSLFRGREDIYALRWENNKTNRHGYSPACENEWQPKFCGKPKIKCNACPNQKWKPLTDQAIYAHLTGQCFIGLYPLLLDEHCYFLAIDFDKEAWQSDISVFESVCSTYNVPHLIERSQSGNGAHVWIFFTDPIPAAVARNLGTALLTLTMQLHPHLSMDSYDRLFPNQDTLPKGGFGNLIALPLQGKRRKENNSTFINVDDGFLPYTDPWRILAEVKKLTLEDVQLLLGKIQNITGILDINTVIHEDEEQTPWEKQKNTSTIYPIISEIMPREIAIVKADLLYVPIKNLPAKLINSIRKIAAFQNPEFYRAQAMRLSVFGKPRVIHCAELFSEHIGLPRGCEEALMNLLSHYHIQLSIIDKQQLGEGINAIFQGELSPEQLASVDALMQHNIGVLSAATGFGKTVIAAKMIAERKTNTLILVHRQQLLEQWQERLMTFLGLTKNQIGVVKAGKFKLTNQIDIAMLQSLVKQDVVASEVSQYGHVIVDECHHLSAFSFEQVLKNVKAKYVLGLTATPFRKDGHQPIIFMQCGSVRFQTSKKVHMNAEQHLTVYPKHINLHYSQQLEGITALYQALASDEMRNQMILEDIITTFHAGRCSLLLTNRTQHLEWFLKKLNEAGVTDAYVLKGGMRKKSKDEIMQKLEQSSNRILLATGSYIGEGFDDPKLDTLFLALPVSWHGTLQQYLGRLHRKHENKQTIQVYDYVDIHSTVYLRMYQKRAKKYKAKGYSIDVL